MWHPGSLLNYIYDCFGSIISILKGNSIMDYAKHILPELLPCMGEPCKNHVYWLVFWCCPFLPVLASTSLLDC